MKQLRTLILLALLAGCARTSREFVQGNVRIDLPVIRELGPPALEDGGTLEIAIRDAKGRGFTLFIDHRINSPTPGAIYLNAYPGESNSIRVLDAPGFKQRVGDFDYH
jgi:hypothetical protein